MMRADERLTSQGDTRRLEARGFLERHAIAVLALWTLSLLCVLLLAGEAVLRRAALYRIDYYVGVRISNRLIVYPFGDMPFNSNGYPDRDWDLHDPRPRVGFWGDSITSGVGAGFGYRYSDIIRSARGDQYYMNFGGVLEDGIADAAAADRIIATSERFGLRRIVYAMDLNDILPDRGTGASTPSALHLLRPWIKKYLDVLRTRSYLYNFLRAKAAIVAARLGCGYHGDEAFELHPARNEVIVNQTVGRINGLWVRLRARGIELCVVVFPYEMQISDHAADTYLASGIRWSDELLRGQPQGMVRNGLAPGIAFADASEAFSDVDGLRGSSAVGEYFVYNKGDALDWEHPNRAGHRLIADYLLSKTRSCL